MSLSPDRDGLTNLHCIFDDEDMRAAEVWKLVYQLLKTQGKDAAAYQISQGFGRRRAFRDPQKLLSPAEFLQEIELDDSNMFAATSPEHGRHQQQGLSFYPKPLQGGFQRFAMGSTAPELSPRDWAPIIHSLALMGRLVFAKVGSQNYVRWQNTSDPAQYEKNFGSIAGFTLIEHGSPPVNRTILDTSRNPGRGQVVNQMDVQATADLWLGPLFWEYAPCTKADVLASDIFIEKRDTPHYLYVKSWPHPFTRPDGEQGRVQQKLWRLLFNEDCEWPPGSGGISDVPVGGPPELMPPGPFGDIKLP